MYRLPDSIDDYWITCRTKIIRPEITYDFHLQFGILEAVGVIHGYTDETFLETELTLMYRKYDSNAKFELVGKPPKNITIAMLNLSQLEFLSDDLSTVMNSKWEEKIRPSIQKNFVTIMNDCAKSFNAEKFRPFV